MVMESLNSCSSCLKLRHALPSLCSVRVKIQQLGLSIAGVAVASLRAVTEVSHRLAAFGLWDYLVLRLSLHFEHLVPSQQRICLRQFGGHVRSRLC